MPVFDTTALLYLLEDGAKPPLDPATGKPVVDTKSRVDFLVRTIDSQDATIIIPTPVLSEALVHAGKAGPGYLATLTAYRCFRIASFDQRAAVELAAMIHDAIEFGNLHTGSDSTRAKLKFDRQIIAIARTQNETTIYSDDGDIAKLGRTFNLDVIPIHALPRAPEDTQKKFSLRQNSG